MDLDDDAIFSKTDCPITRCLVSNNDRLSDRSYVYVAGGQDLVIRCADAVPRFLEVECLEDEEIQTTDVMDLNICNQLNVGADVNAVHFEL